jgi:hypothetical protein
MIQHLVQHLKRIPPAVMTFVTGVPRLTPAQKARLAELEKEERVARFGEQPGNEPNHLTTNEHE